MLLDALPAALLVATLVAAVVRPHRLPEAVVAVASALLVLATGAVPVEGALAELEELGPVLAFLAALLVLAHLSAAEGVFTAAGSWLVRRSRGQPPRFLASTFALAVVTTLVLSLDATALLLTPTVLVAARRARIAVDAPLHLVGHLTNSASLLLPVANLTNLLALSALTGLGVHFGEFVLLMAAPALVVLAVEYAVTRWYFRDRLAGSDDPPPADLEPADLEDDEPAEPAAPPRFALVLLGLTLLAVAVTGSLGIEPAWAALVGAVVLAAHSLAGGRVRLPDLGRALDVPFLAFVAGLSVTVRAVTESPVGDLLHRLTPGGESLLAVLGFVAVAALLANVANNLPALLILLPPAVAAGPVAVLAVLVGVNVGPNLTYPGSLATLLWRRSLQRDGYAVSWPVFWRHGLLTVPAQLVLAGVALWATAQVLPV